MAIAERSPMSGAAGRPLANAPERLFERLHGRIGERYLSSLVALLVAFIHIVVIPLYTTTLFPYFRTSWNQFGRIVLAFELGLLVASAAVFVVLTRRHRSLIRWTAGDHEDPQAAWRTAVVALPGSSLIIGAAYALACVAPAIYTSHLVGLSAVGAVLYVIFLAITVSGMVVFGYMFFEQGFRPIVREIAESMTPDLAAMSGAPSLGRKMLVLLPAINVFTGMFVAVVSSNRLDVEGRLAVTIGTALGLTLTVALGLTMMFRHSVVSRIAELRRAIRAVDAGDLSVRLPMLAGDELDEVGQSFNEMVTGLAERDALKGENVELAARVVYASDEARRTVERDLHDGAQQHLVLLRLKLGMLKKAVAGDPASATRLVDEVQGDLDNALDELRSLAHGIYPATLENEGLSAALGEAARRSAIPAVLDSDGIARYPRDVEAAVYFCCLEALQNAAKYAGEEAKVDVHLSDGAGRLSFEVSDNGAGFDAAAVADSHGLRNMQDRIRALSGELAVESAAGSGTTVRGSIPL
jgi:signal transduction histidine kinase